MYSFCITPFKPLTFQSSSPSQTDDHLNAQVHSYAVKTYSVGEITT